MATTGEVPGKKRRGARLRPGLVHGGLLAALLGVFMTVLFTAPAAPPPTIAEISPNAVQQIKEAPVEQANQFGTGEAVGGGGAGTGTGPGEGGGGPGAGDPAPTIGPSVAPSAAIQVPRVLNCVGNPPRQIEDPQSPPCIGYWVGDNGGDTSPGVTRDAIRIALPNTSDTTLLNFFNKRFQFYGRKLVAVGKTGQYTADCSPAQQTAAAADVAQSQVFASVFYWACYGLTYNREMARHKIVSVAMDPIYTDSELQEMAPYVWQYPMANNRLFSTIGEWACQRLRGQVASKAGTSDGIPMSNTPRKFGLLMSQDTSDQRIDATSLIQALEACGIELAQKISWTNSPSTNSTPIAQMKNAGVTSIICLCSYASVGHGYSRNATALAYHPEWLLSSYIFMDMNAFIRQYMDPAQVSHVLGVTVNPRQQDPDHNPAWWAYSEATGGSTRAKVTGFEKSDNAWANNNTYRALLLLASGIQMAGPNLTPESLERGLHEAAFPNPPSPLQPGKVGFAGGLHSMTVDAADYYYDPAGQSPYRTDGTGTICYVAGGARHTDDWPEGHGPYSSPICDG